MVNHNVLPSAQDLEAAYTLDALVSYFDLPSDVAQGLVSQAEAGTEATQVLTRGTFRGLVGTSSSRSSLDSYFGSTWRVIDRDGRPLYGTPSAELRDADGHIVNETFINELNTIGVAVETDNRDNFGKKVPVNRVWRLQPGTYGNYLPIARVLTIDADASEEARPTRADSNPRAIEISEQVVIFPGLKLPERAQQ